LGLHVETTMIIGTGDYVVTFSIVTLLDLLHYHS